MKQDSNTIWTLGSGNWCVNSEQGYVLEGFLDSGKLTEHNRVLFEQLYLSYLDQKSGKIFPPEFKYHPETGKILERRQHFNANDVWIAPYGQSVFVENQNRKDNGLQYSRQLKTLKNKTQTADEKAQNEISFSFSGSMEFFSICIGTDIPQLIALNKNSGDIYLLLESSKIWAKLNATSSLLDGCPKEWQEYWGIESYYEAAQKKHILLLPTNHGLAELSIQGKDLKYSVKYYGDGKCLSKPIYWNNAVYVPMNHDGNFKIWNHREQAYIELSNEIIIQNFCYAVFDNRNLIWLSEQGQCVLTLGIDNKVSVKFSSWLPIYQPDFNFGPPFMDKEGDFYQLCWKIISTHDDLQNYRVYIRLNSENIIEKMTGSPRFSTGSTAYEFEEKIRNRKNKANIWDTAKKNEHFTLFVPLMEDQNQDKDLVVGICFRDIGSKSKDSILNDSSKQFISLFIDTLNHGVHHFYSGQLSEPIKKSRFFYHHNRLYFYHSDLSELQCWEIET
ncbi:hypothetical protein [Acinetobacter modestus]|uniref:hypothetical protein n=1 Tax=Acinetobacter modestus TaxID=1776740 RepID=UPI003019DF51